MVTDIALPARVTATVRGSGTRTPPAYSMLRCNRASATIDTT